MESFSFSEEDNWIWTKESYRLLNRDGHTPCHESKLITQITQFIVCELRFVWSHLTRTSYKPLWVFLCVFMLADKLPKIAEACEESSPCRIKRFAGSVGQPGLNRTAQKSLQGSCSCEKNSWDLPPFSFCWPGGTAASWKVGWICLPSLPFCWPWGGFILLD